MVTLAANVESMKGITDRAATPKRIFFFVLNPRERCDLTLPLKGELNMLECTFPQRS
jgi:hypothetical protein